MSAKKSYSRYFIILQEDEKGFSVDANKFPTGYSKIENKNNKCKISYYVQNLNKSKEPYYMILICSKKNENNLIKLGKMNIDDYGRAEISYEYDINNIANSGIPMDKIKGAAIVHFQETSMKAVLTGFVSGTRLEGWKKYSIIENKSQLREDKNETDEPIDKSNDEIKKNSSFDENRDIAKDKEIKEKVEMKKENIDDNKNKSENNMFDEYEKNIENSKDVNSDIRESNDVDRNESNDVDRNESVDENESDNITDDFSHVDNTSRENSSNESEITKEFNDITESEEYSVKNTRSKDKEKYKDKCECNCKDKYKEKYEEKYEYKCKDKYKDKEYDKDYPVGMVGEFFKNLAKDLEEVTDVCPEIGKCKWYKVPVEKLENINETSDFNKYTVLYYPMICYYPYIKKYGHYLVGYKCDSKDRMRYLVYAIPGTKIMNDQPFGGATGFTAWVCKDHIDDKMYSLGYWVMFYDFKNSRIMMPVI